MLTATLTYSPALVRTAALGYVRRGFGVTGFAAMALLLAAGGFIVALQPSSWLAGVACGAAAVLVALLFGVYLIHYRRGMAKLRRMGEPRAVLELTDAELRVTSQGGSYSAPWSVFSAIWQFPSFWLLIIGDGQFMTIPLASLSPEMQSFLSSHIGADRR